MLPLGMNLGWQHSGAGMLHGCQRSRQLDGCTGSFTEQMVALMSQNLQPSAGSVVSCRGSNKESLVCASSSTNEDMWCTTMDGLGGLYTQIRAVAKPCGSDLPSDILDVDF